MENQRTYKDHVGRMVALRPDPQRIISLCPSQTATLFHLGLGPQVVGRTNFCIHPADAVREVARVGGTKKLRFEAVADLSPDLIIAEKEENTREMVARLAETYPVYVTDVRDMGSALRMIRDLGRITGRAEAGAALATEVARGFEGLQPLARRRRCAYLIWRQPWMAASADTFIDAMLDACGLDNVAHAWEGRYPEFDLEKLAASAPEVVMLSSEPFPFAETHIQEIQTALPDAQVMLVDGEMFSWYGSHLLQTPAYLQKLMKLLKN